MWQQIASGMSYEGVTGAGTSCPTRTSGTACRSGGVIVTEDTIIQGGSWL